MYPKLSIWFDLYALKSKDIFREWQRTTAKRTKQNIIGRDRPVQPELAVTAATKSVFAGTSCIHGKVGVHVCRHVCAR